MISFQVTVENVGNVFLRHSVVQLNSLGLDVDRSTLSLFLGLKMHARQKMCLS